MFEVLVQF